MGDIQTEYSRHHRKKDRVEGTVVPRKHKRERETVMPATEASCCCSDFRSRYVNSAGDVQYIYSYSTTRDWVQPETTCTAVNPSPETGRARGIVEPGTWNIQYTCMLQLCLLIELLRFRGPLPTSTETD